MDASHLRSFILANSVCVKTPSAVVCTPLGAQAIFRFASLCRLCRERAGRKGHNRFLPIFFKQDGFHSAYVPLVGHTVGHTCGVDMDIS